MLEMFQRYTFSYAAIYGHDFNTSATKLYHLLRARGVNLVINDLITDKVLALGNLTVGVVCVLISVIYRVIVNV